MKIIISGLLLLFALTGYSQNKLDFTFSLNGTKTSFTGPSGQYNTYYGPACKCNENYYKPTLGITTGIDFQIINSENFQFLIGSRYNLTGTRVKVEYDGIPTVDIEKSVFAHYLQLPFSAKINVLDPFHFYAGLSYNFAFWFTKDYLTIYSSELLRSDFRAHAGVGWQFERFALFAQFEESLFHFGKPSFEPTPGKKVALLEPNNTNISLGIKIPVSQILKK